MAFSDKILQVQQANDIVELVGEHVKLTGRGREFVGLCPFHEDHRPSLYVSPAKQIYKCFACGAGGDVIKFIQTREGLSFGQALRRLAERAGLSLPDSRARDRARGPQEDPTELAKVNAWAADRFHANLFDPRRGRAALDYLAGRKIPQKATRYWKLGLACETANELLASAGKKGFSPPLLAAAGLVKPRPSGGFTGRFSGRLIFPIIDATGRVTGFGGRTLDGDGPKYINSPATVLFDKGRSLYGLFQARTGIVSAGMAVVVEGYTDCIMAHLNGCRIAVATLGTSFTTEQARLLRRYSRKMVLLFDSDAAGTAAADRAIEICLRERVDISATSVPEGKDPCDFLLSSGGEAFGRLIAEAPDIFEFKWARLREKLREGGGIHQKRTVLDEFMGVLAEGCHAGSLSPTEKGLMINRLSVITGVSPGDLDAGLARMLKQRTPGQEAPATGGLEGLYSASQREIIEVLLNEPSLLSENGSVIRPAIFEDPLYARIAAVIFEASKDTGNPPLAALLAGVDSAEVASKMVELASEGEKKGNFQKRLGDALSAIEMLEKRNARTAGSTGGERSLEELSRKVSKRNPHSIGMV